MTQENPLFSNLSRDHGFERLHTEGKVPESLRGTLYRAGPALFERFGRRLKHPFEADGAISAVRLTGGHAEGAARIVKSAGYLEEEAQGRFLYNSGARWLDRMRAAFRREAKTTGNTSVFAHQDRLFALMEGGHAQEMDADTLDTLAAEDFGVVKTAFSAHPHRVARLGTTFNFGVRYESQMWIDLYALPDTGAARHLTSIQAPWMSMVHDFVATERHLVLFLLPVKLVLYRALLGMADLEKLFRWRPELGARVVVVPLDNVEGRKTFELEPFWVWHFANGFSEGQTVTVDACRYDEFSLSDIGKAEEDVTPKLQRLTLDLSTGTAAWSSLSDHDFEFPSVHPAVSGSRHEELFSQVRVGKELGIGRTDSRGITRAWLPPAELELSEPVLVPRSAQEGDVWVLDLILDHKSRRSHLAVLDGQHLEDGPVARVHFDQAIPLTFHGTFVPELAPL